MTKREAVRLFGSEYSIAKALGISRSAVMRWKTHVPEHRVEILRAVPPELRKLKRGGLRVAK